MQKLRLLIYAALQLTNCSNYVKLGGMTSLQRVNYTRTQFHSDEKSLKCYITKKKKNHSSIYLQRARRTTAFGPIPTLLSNLKASRFLAYTKECILFSLHCIKIVHTEILSFSPTTFSKTKTAVKSYVK